jgi:Sec-independent protein translocase protein TatA
MEILNIGPLELIFIISLMVILLGPEGMKQSIRVVGTWIRNARQSSLWKDVQSLNREAKELPIRLAREAGYEEHIAEIRRNTQITVDLYETPARQPGDVRSPGGRRLRLPQGHAWNSSLRTENNAVETTAAEIPPIEPVDEI